MLYTSIDNKKIKEIKKLNQKKYRDLNGLFLIEGEHLVNEANVFGNLKTLIILEGYDFKLDIDTITVNKTVMNYISNLENPPKVMGICTKLKEKDYKKNIVVLDNIQDPGNLGTIIRSSVAFNIDTIIMANCVDLYNPKVLRATQGLIFHINILNKKLEDILPKLKQDDYLILGTDVNNGKSLKTLEKINKFAIIMGNEGSGISNYSKSMTDENINIKINKNCESLNVGVATSIILYELDK